MRVYTEDELTDCDRDPRLLAARFAAKEATMKALACRDRLPWQSIAVACHRSAWPTLELSGPAAELARAQGVRSVSAGFIYGDSHTAAVVVSESS